MILAEAIPQAPLPSWAGWAFFALLMAGLLIASRSRK